MKAGIIDSLCRTGRLAGRLKRRYARARGGSARVYRMATGSGMPAGIWGLRMTDPSGEERGTGRILVRADDSLGAIRRRALSVGNGGIVGDSMRSVRQAERSAFAGAQAVKYELSPRLASRKVAAGADIAHITRGAIYRDEIYSDTLGERMRGAAETGETRRSRYIMTDVRETLARRTVTSAEGRAVTSTADRVSLRGRAVISAGGRKSLGGRAVVLRGNTRAVTRGREGLGFGATASRIAVPLPGITADGVGSDLRRVGGAGGGLQLAQGRRTAMGRGVGSRGRYAAEGGGVRWGEVLFTPQETRTMLETVQLQSAQKQAMPPQIQVYVTNSYQVDQSVDYEVVWDRLEEALRESLSVVAAGG